MRIDFGKTSEDYRKHRRGFPPSFFSAIAEEGLDLEGKNLLDLGTGTGTLALGFARAGAEVIGLDPSIEQLTQGQNDALSLDLSPFFLCGRAESLPFGDNGFDVVSAGQCWHWFNGPKAAAEILRVLRPEGTLLIAHFDWLPCKGSVSEATEALILEYNPAWAFSGGDGKHPEHEPVLLSAGFEDLRSFFFVEDVLYSHEAWRGRIRASAGVGASLVPEEVNAFDEAHRRMLLKSFSEDPLRIPHGVFGLLAGR
jgi:SAM-dependent methyltransferase